MSHVLTEIDNRLEKIEKKLDLREGSAKNDGEQESDDAA